ncbi:hypothetical protein GCM10011383_37100 [Hymenobacter cavernae]|uniref:Uncharacterized protein n=1 Tax=Hymenobacter cavernae TaxID=2044852 RepID=A0ABQ1UQ06_9BACT|nr:hypothetical protein GCM10011383_37100 [Hymenobacter cavernae]
MGGVVQLADNKTAVFISSSESNDVRVLLLQATGKTAWEGKISRFQFAKPEVIVLGIGTGKSTQSGRERQALSSFLNPVDVFTNSSDLYTVEVLLSDVDKKEKESALKHGSTVVQHFDESGQLQRAVFAPTTVEKKVERRVMAHFAEGSAYYKIARERNEREDKTEHFLEVYDLNKKTRRRITLGLPATPERTKSNIFYNDWCYLGHRSGQSYLVRRLRGHSKKDNFSRMPVEFEVLVVNNDGQKIGGFVTTLGLEKGTYPIYSGSFQQAVEQSHIYREHSTSKYTFDEYDLITGGFGDFYLDYATGDVVIYGEYSHGSEGKQDYGYGDDNEGLFMHRYDLNGVARSKYQTAYPKELSKVQKNAFSGGKMYRSCTFLPDPVTGNLEFTISCGVIMGGGGKFFLKFDKELKYKSFIYRPIEVKERRLGSEETEISYVPPVWITQGTSANVESRELAAAAKEDPLYAAIWKMHQKTAKTNPDTRYYLAHPASGALLLEQQKLVGGSVSIYTF